MNTGIYYIRSIVNGTIYIGKTERSFVERWKEHANALQDQTHHNQYLQRDCNQHGLGSLLAGVIIELRDPNYIARAERLLIEWCKQHYRMYNIEGVLVPFSGEIPIKKDYSGINQGLTMNKDTLKVDTNALQSDNRVFDARVYAEKQAKYALMLMYKKYKELSAISNTPIHKVVLIQKTFNIKPGRGKAYKTASRLYEYGKSLGLWE